MEAHFRNGHISILILSLPPTCTPPSSPPLYDVIPLDPEKAASTRVSVPFLSVHCLPNLTHTTFSYNLGKVLTLSVEDLGS